jgi:hypothetical protein
VRRRFGFLAECRKLGPAKRAEVDLDADVWVVIATPRRVERVLPNGEAAVEDFLRLHVDQTVREYVFLGVRAALRMWQFGLDFLVAKLPERLRLDLLFVRVTVPCLAELSPKIVRHGVTTS